ncbi:MAG: M81 family metallopeptidase [Pseudomonadota bacterium]
MRIFTASLATETNTFSPLPTSRATFEETFYAPPGTHPDDVTLCTAPLFVARRRAAQEGFDLIEGSCFWAEPSGTVDRKSYEAMRDEILDQLRAAMPLDGVLMGFHGALVVAGLDDAEGDVLDHVRQIVGPTCVIGCEYDPHVHLTEKRVRLADVSILFKEYPHVDVVPRAQELVTLVLKTIRGEIKPVCSLYDPRMIDFFPTTTEPMRSFVDKMMALEGKDEVLSVSLAHGFMHADTPDMGTRVLVITNDAKPHGDALAQTLGEEVFEGRGRWCAPVLTLDEALDQVLAHQGGLAILAEPADNAGGGAASDNTMTLHALIARGAQRVAVAPVWDAQAVGFCHAAGLGAAISLRFGGKASAGSGDPVDADVTVIGLAHDAIQMFGDAKVPLGNAAAVRIGGGDGGGIDVILIEKRTQALGLGLFTELGLDPAAYQALVLKSAQHFAGAFGPLASLIVRAETGGACPTQPQSHPYKSVKRPIWPLDEQVAGKALI